MSGKIIVTPEEAYELAHNPNYVSWFHTISRNSMGEVNATPDNCIGYLDGKSVVVETGFGIGQVKD